MPGSTPMAVVEADDALWQEYQDLTVRSYGHRVEDIARLREHGDARVAVRDGRVIGGGLALAVPQFFGGLPVPGACLAGGCIAPEARGSRLWSTLLEERLRPLKEQGAVLATAWTASTGYGHRMGWAAPSQVYSWTVPTQELRGITGACGFDIVHGADEQDRERQQKLAGDWNGPWQRPSWWPAWQQAEHPGMTHYRFALPGRDPDGLLAIAFDRDRADGRRLVVHDFWAATSEAATAMLGFLGRHHSRIPTVMFQRTALPPVPLLQSHLRRAGAACATSWHPWMLRILDPAEAVRRRGWPEDLDLTLPFTLRTDDGSPSAPLLLRIASGAGELTPHSGERHELALTSRQFAHWYAGGYRTPAAALLDGVHGEPRSVAQLVRATSDREPWMPEYF
ncbi:enhanced intracellular survival protein Eis [Streptomyces sp. NPDC051546]|uniref:enhanced intracellular survival protein Eis n=1 Tax=Streptomyces sp. NPDC051546 TaxID=3365655 RepID=UPI0037B4AA47